MPDNGVQCCLNDAHLSNLEAELSFLRKLIDDMKDDMDEYSNKWMFDYNKIIANQIVDMTELVLKYDEEAPASSSVYHNISGQ